MGQGLWTWLGSLVFSGIGVELLGMLRSLRQVLLMKSADSSETLCRNCVTVLDSLPTTVTTTGIPTELY